MKADLDSRYVFTILSNYDGAGFDEKDAEFAEDSALKGYGEYPHCIVMDAGTMSLKQIVDTQNFAGWDWDTIRNIMKQITKAVWHLHSKGLIHGDLKGTDLKL